MLTDCPQHVVQPFPVGILGSEGWREGNAKVVQNNLDGFLRVCDRLGAAATAQL